ncbi:hypothetical protein KQI63_16445 [bacterium]|nr:hypothetical protein [bacterium]
MLRINLSKQGQGTGTWIATVAIELVLLVISILLALSVNNWREDANNRDLVASALTSIQTQIEENRDSTAVILEEHEALLDTIQKTKYGPEYQGKSALQVFVEQMGDDGLELTIPLQSAYNTAIASGAMRYMDYQTASMLAGLHSMETNGVIVATRRLQENFLTAAMIDSSQAQLQLQLLTMYLTDIVFQERAIIEEYDRVLARMEGTE